MKHLILILLFIVTTITKGESMLLKPVFEKIANSEPLTVQEQAEFVQFGQNLQMLESVYSKLLVSGTPNVQLESPVVSNPRWFTAPLHPMELRLTTNTSVPNATPTYITFDSVIQKGHAFDSSDLSKIEKVANGYSTHIDGVIVFAANATGYRALYLELFDINGVSLGASPFFLLPGHNLADNWFPFTFTHNAQDTAHYFKVYAYQTSGGNLDVTDIYMTVSVH